MRSTPRSNHVGPTRSYLVGRTSQARQGVMLLDVKDLKVQFEHDGETVKAVNGIDFAINKNEVLGLVGQSGSGKTVTALSVMNLLPRRDCVVCGEIVKNSGIAMIFQEPFTCLNPVLRVGEQIDEAVLVRRSGSGQSGNSVSTRSVRAETFALLEKVKLNAPQRIYDSYPHLLSGGQRQRAMIAMALALSPGLLIADEPTTALDVTTQAAILDLILSLKKELGMSVLFITHDFGIINKIADRVLVMKDGKIVERGLKGAVLSSPTADYTKKLLEAVPKLGSTGTGLGQTLYHPDERPVPVVTVRNLSKTFVLEKGVFKRKAGCIEAVRDVNFEIKEGRTLGIVGESGSGKTTLAKLLAGLLKADSGSVGICAREAQIVFQDPYSSLDPRMRMRDIILEGPAIRGTGKSEREKILQKVLFKVYLNLKDSMKYPHQFSGGQRQRISLARALAVKPRILILDEPVSSLDVIIQSEILNLLKDLQKELALTYVFISHDLAVVERMADDVAVMYKGEIVEFGSRSEIYRSPKHPYTKRLLAGAL